MFKTYAYQTLLSLLLLCSSIMCITLTHAADFASSSSSNVRISHLDLSPEDVLDLLSKDGRVTIELDFMDQLWELTAKFPQEKTKQLVPILIALSEEDQVLSTEHLKKAVQILTIKPAAHVTNTRIDNNTPIIIPSESATWKNVKTVIGYTSTAAVGSYAVTKAIQYYLTHKN